MCLAPRHGVMDGNSDSSVALMNAVNRRHDAALRSRFWHTESDGSHLNDNNPFLRPVGLRENGKIVYF